MGRGGYVAPAEHDNHSQGPVKVIRVWTAQLGSKTKLRRLLDWATFYLVAMGRAVMLPRQDVIVAMTTPPYIAWAGVLQKLLHPSTRLVLWNMDCYPDAAELAGVIKKNGIVSRLMRRMNRALFSRLDHLICLDVAMRDLLVPQYGPRQRELPVSVVPNWERLAAFPAAGPSRGPWEKAGELGLSGKFVVLYMGNTGVGHPFDAVIAGAKRLRDRGVVFLIVGGGKRWQWLHEAKAKEQVENLVLHDYVPEEQRRAVLAAADCALITLESRMAGVMSPSKLHGNLAAGLPVIYLGPEKSNVDEAIRRFDCGISLRDGDVEGMVGFIEGLMGDQERLKNYRKAARQAFETAYCDERTLPRFCAILDSLTPARTGEPAGTEAP